MVQSLGEIGLGLNVKEAENIITDENESRDIRVNGNELANNSAFKYLRFDGSVLIEVNSRAKADGLFRWRSLKAVLCDKKISRPWHTRQRR